MVVARRHRTRPREACWVMPRVIAHSGEPLWRVSGHRRKFCLITSRAETCENRRLPGTAHRFAARWPGSSESEAMAKCIALGYSREPPVATLSGRTER
jgi:hypothetical protein